MSRPPAGWSFVDWKDAQGNIWRDTLVIEEVDVMRKRIENAGGKVFKVVRGDAE